MSESRSKSRKAWKANVQLSEDGGDRGKKTGSERKCGTINPK